MNRHRLPLLLALALLAVGFMVGSFVTCNAREFALLQRSPDTATMQPGEVKAREWAQQRLKDGSLDLEHFIRPMNDAERDWWRAWYAQNVSATDKP